MAELPSEYFTLTRSQRGAIKLVEGGYIYGKQRKIGEVTHWLCEQRGFCKAIIHRSTELFFSVHKLNYPIFLTQFFALRLNNGSIYGHHVRILYYRTKHALQKSILTLIEVKNLLFQTLKL